MYSITVGSANSDEPGGKRCGRLTSRAESAASQSERFKCGASLRPVTFPKGPLASPLYSRHKGWNLHGNFRPMPECVCHGRLHGSNLRRSVGSLKKNTKEKERKKKSTDR